YNVTIRPVSDTRVEIILPTGGRRRAHAEKELWDEFLKKVKAEFPVKFGPGKTAELRDYLKFENPSADIKAIETLVNEENEKAWKETVKKTAEKFVAKPEDRSKVEAPTGNVAALAASVAKLDEKLKKEDVEKFAADAYQEEWNKALEVVRAKFPFGD